MNIRMYGLHSDMKFIHLNAYMYKHTNVLMYEHTNV